MSFAVVTAVYLAALISTTIVFLYKLLFGITKNVSTSLLGCSFFLLGAFLIFKSGAGGVSTYLYWQYSYCIAYCYNGGSYLCSAFGLYLLYKEFFSKTEETFRCNFKTGFLFVILYFLIFSFVPAVCFLATISFGILIRRIFQYKSLTKVLQKSPLQILIIMGFIIKQVYEFIGTFGDGYFSAPTDISSKLITSSFMFISTFAKMNKLFLAVVIVCLCFMVTLLFLKKKINKLTNKDRMYIDLLGIMVLSLILMGIYFVLFGVIDLGHIYTNALPVRCGVTYVFYFLFILIVTVCLIYLVQEIKQITVLLPLLLFIMLYSVMIPGYSDSVYMDTSPMQRYEIMNQLVEAAQEADSNGKYHLIVHMPSYSFFGGYGYTTAFYDHNITNHYITFEFVIEPDSDSIYFE